MSAAAYRRDIDGLRAVSVLAVVGYHAFPNFVRGGFVGVDIFFVISGFLITGILLRESGTGHAAIADFYGRRIRRILPALVLVLAACLAVCWAVLLSVEFREFGKHLAAASVFASNLALWSEAGYFDAAAETKPLLHLWSLAIEEQYYLVFPLLLFGLRRAGAATWRVLAGLGVASLAADILVLRHDATTAFYAPYARMWELLAGAILACVQSERPATARPARRIGTPAAWFGGALIATAILGYDRTMAYPGWRALLPVGGAVLMIAAGPQAWLNRRLLSWRVLVGIGLVSYPLYLWHWPVLRLYVIARGELVPAETRLALVAVSGLLAWLTWRGVEAALRRRPGVHVPALLLASLLALGGLGVAAWFGLWAPRLQAPGLERVVGATTDWQFPPPRFRTLLHEGRRIFEQRGMRAGTVLFIGDSNVQQYAPRISALLADAPERYRSVVFATQGGCLPIPHYSLAPAGCDEQLAAALRYAARPEVERVVIGGYWLNVPAGPARDEAVRSIGQLVERLAATRKVYLLMNIAAGPEFDPRSMYTGSRLSTLAANPRPEPLALDRFLLEYGALREALRAAARDHGGIPIDPLPWLCPGGLCPVLTEDGRPLYMDAHHMRPFHAARSAGFLDVTLLDDGVPAPQTPAAAPAAQR